MRRHTPLFVAVLLASALAAASASGLAMHYGTPTGPLVAPGSTYNGQSSGNVIVSNDFLGLTTVIVCSSAQFTGTLRTNNTTGGVAGTIDTMAFTNCTNQAQSKPCVVTTAGLPWNPHLADAGYGQGGLIAPNATTMSWGTGTPTSTNYIDMTGLSCWYQVGQCSFYPGDATALSINSPVTDSVIHRMQGAWTNASPPQLAFNNQPIYSDPSCASSGAMTMKFTVRTGSTVGSGNLVYLS